MTQDQRETPRMQLEGLVLSDGRGALYEVPCVVIERYRVTEERATELAGPAPDSGVLGAPSWSVDGGIYVAAAPAAANGRACDGNGSGWRNRPTGRSAADPGCPRD